MVIGNDGVNHGREHICNRPTTKSVEPCKNPLYGIFATGLQGITGHEVY